MHLNASSNSAFTINTSQITRMNNANFTTISPYDCRGRGGTRSLLDQERSSRSSLEFISESNSSAISNFQETENLSVGLEMSNSSSRSPSCRLINNDTPLNNDLNQSSSTSNFNQVKMECKSGSSHNNNNCGTAIYGDCESKFVYFFILHYN